VSCCCRSSGERSGWLDTSTSIACWEIQLHKWKNYCSQLIWSDMKLITHMSYVPYVENVVSTHIMFKGDVICFNKITLQDIIICIKLWLWCYIFLCTFI
jgi:hypothetical protein